MTLMSVLTNVELAAVRAALYERLHALTGTGRDDLAALAVPTGISEPMDRVVAQQERGLAHARLNQLDGLSRDLTAALARLDDGTYGLCAQCDEPISVARLKARPEATLCLACAEHAERI